jgi:hypothetical protein
MEAERPCPIDEVLEPQLPVVMVVVARRHQRRPLDGLLLGVLQRADAEAGARAQGQGEAVQQHPADARPPHRRSLSLALRRFKQQSKRGVSMSIDLFLKKEEELGRQCSPSPCDSLSSRSRQ